jgi:hypothetical protein
MEWENVGEKGPATELLRRGGDGKWCGDVMVVFGGGGGLVVMEKREKVGKMGVQCIVK